MCQAIKPTSVQGLLCRLKKVNVNSVNANHVHAPVSTVTAADIEMVLARLDSLEKELSKIAIRKPIKASNGPVSQHIRRAPSLRRRFE